MKKIIFISIAIAIATVVLFFLFIKGGLANFLSSLFLKNEQEEISLVQAAPPSIKGLVGYWTMDSKNTFGKFVYDHSGNGRTLSSSYGYAPTSTSGKVNEAIEFNVVSLSKPMYIDGGDVLDMDQTDEVTLSAWIKTTSTAVTGMGVISKWNSGDFCHDGDPQSYLLIVDNSGRVAAYINSESGGEDNGHTTTQTVNDGNWHFLTFSVKDGTGNYNIYIDGVNVLQATKSGTGIHNSAFSFRVGIGDTCAGEESAKFVGSIDEVRVYNRALTAEEVQFLYNSKHVTEVPKRNGLVGWWTLDAGDKTGWTMLDKSGNNNDAIVYGATTSTGVMKQALNFNNALSNYVNLGHGNSINIAGDLTMSLWFKTTDTSYDFLLGGYNPVASSQGYSIAKSTCVAGKLSATVGEASAGCSQWITGATTVTDGKWHHVAVTAIGTAGTMYLDGIQDGSNTIGGSATYIGDKYLGEYTGGGDYYFNGQMDDVRLYNYGMSAQEVSNLYNAAKKNYVNAPIRGGLVGWWTLDAGDTNGNGTATTTFDKSGYRNNGALTGTVAETGIIKQAMQFDGVDDAVTISSLPAYNVSALTVSAWAKANGALDSYAKVVEKDYSGVSYPYISFTLERNATSDNFCFGLTTDNTYSCLVGNTIMKVGKWYHLVGVWDGSQTYFYINGVSDATPASKTGTLNFDNTKFLRIGNSRHTGFERWNGDIDDVRIYNYGMSAQEVMNLYNSARRSYK